MTPVASNFIYPTNGSTMDISLPFTWTPVPNVQAYYLYVGTAVGTHNIVNSGETLATSFFAPNLPTTGTFYARIYAKVAGVWRSSDIVFSTSPLRATLITPADGSTGFIAATMPFTWTSVPIAEKYYLYVGTSVGAKDLIDSQELCDQVTCLGGPLGTTWNGLDGGNSIGLGQLVTGQTLYARLWTVVGGKWRYVDSTFTTAGAVTILDPLDGSTKEAVHQKYLWTIVNGGITSACAIRRRTRRTLPACGSIWTSETGALGGSACAISSLRRLAEIGMNAATCVPVNPGNPAAR